MSTYQTAIVEKWNKALALAQSYENAPEKFAPHSKGEVTITSCQHSDGTVIKGECIVSNCTAAELIDILEVTNVETRQKFDNKTKTLKVLEDFTHNNEKFSIRHYVTLSPTIMISERDFLYVEHHTTGENSTIYLTTSVDGIFPSEKCQAVGVRATNVFNYLKMTQEGNDLRVVFIGQYLPGGWIPTAVANQAVFERPLGVVNAAKSIGKSTKGI